MTTDSLHPRIADIIDELTSAQQLMLDTLGAMSVEHRDAPSHDGRWSIAQIVEHLFMVEDGTGRLVSKLLAQAAGTTETEDSTLRHSLDAFHVGDATHHRIEAPDMVVPRAGLSLDESLAKQAVARARVIEAFRLASGRALASVGFPHPILGPLNGYQWGLFIAQHQRRHVAQMQTVQSRPLSG